MRAIGQGAAGDGAAVDAMYGFLLLPLYTLSLSAVYFACPHTSACQ